jgi:hypothetical protein
MTSGLDEIEAAVDAVVNNLLSVDTPLLLEVRIIARVNVVDDRFPAVEMLVKLSRG